LNSEQASHVFDRFWRADTSRVRKSGGTGLGLTIAREDAMLHGGRLQCAGELGVGATFLLTLPREPRVKITSPVTLRVAAEEEDWDSLEDSELDAADGLGDPEQDTASGDGNSEMDAEEQSVGPESVSDAADPADGMRTAGSMDQGEGSDVTTDQEEDEEGKEGNEHA
uniref:ATP-binding protein n=1 Tax=Ancrocorticia populi TaxID=2175228 RepID=UPI002356CD4B